MPDNFDILEDVGKIDKDNHKFFGDKTFKEWIKKNNDNPLINSIKAIHNQHPEKSYDEVISHLDLLGKNATLMSEHLKNEYNVNYQDSAELYTNFKFYCDGHKTFRIVKASDDRGHSDTVTVRFGKEKVSARMESRLLGHIRYLIEHGIVEHRLISDYIRQAVALYTLMYPMINDIKDPEHLKFCIYLKSEANMLEHENMEYHFEIIRKGYELDLKMLSAILNSNIDREERLHEFTMKFTRNIAQAIMNPTSSIEKGKYKDFITRDFNVQQIFSTLVREKLIKQDYVDQLLTKGDISDSAKFEIRHDALPKPVDCSDKICCICGSIETYIHRTGPKWYKHYDNDTGTWDRKSYKCSKCYRNKYL